MQERRSWRYKKTLNKPLTARIFKNSPKKTPLHIEGMIITERSKTGYGRDRIARNLTEKGILVKPSTFRYVLRRYKASALQIFFPKYLQSGDGDVLTNDLNRNYALYFY